MSLWRRQRREFTGVTPDGQIPPRGGGLRRGGALVNSHTALYHSAVWACRRLRADLMAGFPVDVYRDLDGVPVQMPKPAIFVSPGGQRWPWKHWMWASQWELEGCGNVVGLITEVNALGLPARIDLQPTSAVTIIQRKGETEPRYRIDGKEYLASKVWHERMFPVPGMAAGLSPLAAAAYSIGEYLSIQEFVLDWYGGGAVPKARMRNKAKTLKSGEIATAKQWYRDVIQNGDLMVYGADWEYDLIQAEQAGMGWLEGRRYGLADACRFFGVPAELVSAALSSGSVTYANMTQRNLDFLILHLGQAVAWREDALSTLLPRPRYVKLNTGGLLRMDPETQAKVIHQRIQDRTLTPTEARAFYDLPPLTPEQEAEFARLFPARNAAPGGAPDQGRREIMAALDDWLAIEAPRSPAAEMAPPLALPSGGNTIDG